MSVRAPCLLPRFGADRRGAVAVIAAVAGGLLCLFTAAVIDLGVLVLHTRRVQGAADLAALSAVRNLAQGEGAVSRAAQATVEANVAPDVSVTVATGLGVYTPDPAKARNDRFVTGGVKPNAARSRSPVARRCSLRRCCWAAIRCGSLAGPRRRRAGRRPRP